MNHYAHHIQKDTVYFMPNRKKVGNFIELCDIDKPVVLMPQFASQTSKFICEAYEKRKKKQAT